jgi:hypothetical protein
VRAPLPDHASIPAHPLFLTLTLALITRLPALAAEELLQAAQELRGSLEGVQTAYPRFLASFVPSALVLLSPDKEGGSASDEPTPRQSLRNVLLDTFTRLPPTEARSVPLLHRVSSFFVFLSFDSPRR